jgi:copper resistance protein B
MIALILAAAMGAHEGHDMPAPAPVHAGHGSMTFWMVKLEADFGRADDADLGSWSVDSWVGGDASKFRFTTEGDVHDGHVETAEFEALYSMPVSDFFDLKTGVRYDVEPEGRAYLTAGLIGLSPYFFETDAALYLSDRGDLSARLTQEFELLLTQRLVLTPEAEINVFARDVPELNVGAGISDVKLELTLRYEITRKFAPFIRVEYERALGESAARSRAAGDDVEATSLRAGLRVWF